MFCCEHVESVHGGVEASALGSSKGCAQVLERYREVWFEAKSPDTWTRDTEDTKIRVSDTGTTTPGNRTRRTRYKYIKKTIYIYIYIYIYIKL
jgi:hypothetical protein